MGSSLGPSYMELTLFVVDHCFQGLGSDAMFGYLSCVLF